MSHALEAIRKQIDQNSSFNLRDLNLLLTGRGFAVALLLALLFVGPVMKQTDIIAAVAVSIMSIYIAASLILALFFGSRLRSNLEITLYQPEPLSADLSSAVSGKPARLVLKTSEFGLPPGFYLEIQTELEEDGLQFAKHILTGSIQDQAVLTEDVVFPHRGNWMIERINFYLADKINLTYHRWSTRENFGAASLRIEPPTVNISNLPVISSLNRSGDTLPDQNERRGDPYDLKAYHPSDGIKRILWKVYAKSGELISRHPEASMTPEGQVLVYALAAPQDDLVCSACLAYLEQISSLDLEIIFGCLGGDSSAQTPAKAKDLLIDSVWAAGKAESADAAQSVNSLLQDTRSRAPHARIERMVIFCSRRSLSTEAGFLKFAAVADELEKNGVGAHFFIISDPEHGEPRAGRDFITRFFFESQDDGLDEDPELFAEFMNICRNKGWEYQEEFLA